MRHAIRAEDHHRSSVPSADGDRAVVRDNTSERRYEMFVDGKRVGLILYRRRPGAVALIHTEIEPQFELHGLSRLVKGVPVGWVAAST